MAEHMKSGIGRERDFAPRCAAEKPLQVVGAINAYAARLAEATGFRAIYLSGGGVAANSLGIPDLGISTMEDVLTDVRRITDATALPLLVDIDTGWGGAFNIARTIRSMIKAGAAAVHIEDQVGAKRCGHRPGKELCRRKRWWTASRPPWMRAPTSSLCIMARTDALASEGLDARHRARAGLCGRGRRHDLCRGGDGVAQYTAVPQGGGRADPGQHHGVRPDAAVHARRAWRRRASTSFSIAARPTGP